MTERAVSFTSDGLRLAGTLTLPKGARLGVVMLHGSGPLDRDANIPGQRLDVFNALARDLAACGVASLRWDKRGCGASGGDWLRHGLDDLVADGAAAAEILRAEVAGPVLALGHSEGTVLAARLGGAGVVEGTIQLCPFLTPVEDLLIWQAEGIALALPRLKGWSGRMARAMAWLQGGPVAAQRRATRKLRASTAPVIRIGLSRQPARSLRDLLAADLPAIHADNRTPSLLIAAGADVQCPPGDAARIAALNPAAEAQILPGLSHLLRPEDPVLPGFAGYTAQLAHPVDPRVITAITDWLARRFP